MEQSAPCTGLDLQHVNYVWVYIPPGYGVAMGAAPLLLWLGNFPPEMSDHYRHHEHIIVIELITEAALTGDVVQSVFHP